MSDEITERAWAYLDGAMTRGESSQFERDLLDPDVLHGFAEVLMMRELMLSMGPAAMPADLLAHIEESLLSEDAQPRSSWFGRTRSAFGGLGWAVKGPQMVFAVGSDGTRGAVTGIGNARYALAAMPDRRTDGTSRRPLWRRLLGRRK